MQAVQKKQNQAGQKRHQQEDEGYVSTYTGPEAPF